MSEYDYDDDDGEYWAEIDPRFVPFADPGGHSCLRASSPNNPRNLPCPTCGAPNRLTPVDKQLGYQCDACADADEGWGY